MGRQNQRKQKHRRKKIPSLEQIEKVRECVRKERKMKRSRHECGEEDGVRPGGTQSLGLHFLQVEESGRQPFERGSGRWG